MPALPELRSPASAVAGELPPYLQGLWQLRPSLCARAALTRPVWQREPLALTLPAGAVPLLQRAAAAHAAAHARHGGLAVPRGALKPIQQVLFGVLEDARVEWLALQTLPGLRRLWLPWHTADADSGNGFEALLHRLARVLLDPGWVDPHPWVRKVRQMVFADADGRRLAMHDTAAVRQAASLLGHDIGQMRLPFNAKTYIVEPAYRDDNQHLWLDAAASEPVPAPPEAAAPEAGAPSPAPPPMAPAGAHPTAVYPEWDRLIRRYRADWCRVFEDTALAAPAMDAASGQRWQGWLDSKALLVRRSRALLLQAGAGLALGRALPAESGESLYLPAVIDARLAGARGAAPPSRLYLQRPRGHDPMAVHLLLDSSASTARQLGEGRGSVLRCILEAGLVAAAAWTQAGHTCAVQAFCSNTRAEVRLRTLKYFDELPSEPAVLARVGAVQAAGSTRLGAAVRHAGARLAQRPAAQRLLIIVTDGEPHDIDVHDPHYLLADLARAVGEARRRGIAVACINLDAQRQSALLQAMGRQTCQLLGDLAQLPACLLGSVAVLTRFAGSARS
jgi:hypothetical protein